MKIKQHDDDLMILMGTPGGQRWLMFMAALGLVITVVIVYFIRGLWSNGGWTFAFIPLGFGLLLAQALFWMGVVAQFGHETLVLDKRTGTGSYRVFSPIVNTEKPFEFKLEHVHSVVYDRTVERHHDGGAQGMGSDVVSLSCFLKTTRPRRKVLLENTQNGNDERVRALGDAVAGFLGLSVDDQAPVS